MTLDTADISLTTRNARNLWHAGNEAGNGFAPDTKTDDLNGFGAEFGELVLRANGDTDVAVYVADGVVVLVGDSHGPWCVRLR